ncbi:hypothetical protein [Paenibacillus xylaniclasticus]|uniref:hypothetical protein n=1 Tax=Paenibacillus xylaniclasticus TaxID=588083 RepID=UPI000FDA266B|nr:MULTISPECIES: hypothetical protein [Paenibacillus]GFN31498.1 hypothetical protein PCURB6_17580 [Paenibacillus curdlanolyticus]
MIQVKEFIDTDSLYAAKSANEFLATLREDQVVNVCYSSIMKPTRTGSTQRSTILVVFRTDKQE